MNKPIPERVEEIVAESYFKFVMADPDEADAGAEWLKTEVTLALTETDQQAREEGYAQGLKEGQNATAIEVIKGYNAEKLQLIEALKRTGNKEFYLQGDISRRLKEVDANLSALSNPPSQV